MNILKNKKGSITLFVLVSMLFFVLFLAGMYMLSSSKEQTGISETSRIKEIYEKDVNNIDDVYATALRKYELGDILKVGDYIKYDSGENGEILCRVLYDANSEYGLQIISDKNVKKVSIGSDTYSIAVTEYNNAIETLNNEAEVYINSEYAYDARCVGSLPTVGEDGTFTQKDNGSKTYVTPQFTNSGYIKSLGADTNYEFDKTQMETAGIWITGENYWLASRRVDSDASYCAFRMRTVSTELGYSTICNVTPDSFSNLKIREQGLRICIALKYDKIKIVSGNGKSADTAYVIGK